MIDDDADPETLDAWYRRTPDQIAAAKQAKWNAAWSALRMPDDQAYEPETPTAPTGDAVDAAAKRGPPPEKTAWANHELGFLDVLASGETNQGDGGYDVLATPPGQPTRHLASGADGKPEYGHFPNEGRLVPNSSAGRYQFKTEPWNDVVKAHPDVADFMPLNQNKAAWYLAADTYRTKTGRDLASDLKDEGHWPQITETLNRKWSSLPGGTGQQMTQDEFNARLRAATARYQDPGPD